MSEEPRVDEASLRVGRTYLRRIEVFLDVVYALLFFEMFHYLPEPEQMSWADERLGLLELLGERWVDCLRIVIGLGLIVSWWNYSNTVHSSLVISDRRYAVSAVLQMVFVALFLYFSIADPKLEGGWSSPALQSLSLATAGFIGLEAWSRARKRGLIGSDISEERRDALGRRLLVEPVSALLNTGLAFVSPWVWTAGWLVLPVAVTGATKLRDRRRARRSGGDARARVSFRDGERAGESA